MKEIDAIDLLIDDHERVKGMFTEFEAATDAEEKGAIAQLICQELIVHTSIEEQIFYPAVRVAIDDDDLVDEAIVEHDSAKELIDQLQGMTPDDEQYDAKVLVLKEYIEHHVKEEEEEMFPRVRAAELDLEHYGEQMAELKDRLMSQPPMIGARADESTRPRPTR